LRGDATSKIEIVVVAAPASSALYLLKYLQLIYWIYGVELYLLPIGCSTFNEMKRLYALIEDSQVVVTKFSH